MKNSLKYLLLLLLLVTIFFGCRKSLKNASWDTEVLVPLAFGSLELENLVGDSLIQKNANDELSLVYQNDLYNFKIAQDIEVPDTSLKTVVTLDSIVLPNRSLTYAISLGQLAEQDQTGIGQTIINLNGFTAPIPAVSNLSSTGQNIDATSLFTTATLDGGFLDITITNQFPVDITNVEFRITNQTNGDVIVHDTYPLIQAGSSVFNSYPMAGKTVEGTLVGDLLNLDSPGSTNPVKIDTSDKLLIDFLVRDLDVFAATAIFPAQNLISIQNEVRYNLNGPELTYMKIRSGKLVITAVNTIEDSLKLRYAIPGAISPSGQTIDLKSAVAPAPIGGSVQVNEVIDLSGYSIDLTGKNKNLVNTFYNEFSAAIDSSGKLISISLADSISVFYGLQDIVPEYVEGFLGQHHFSFANQSADFELFKKIVDGQLDLEEVNFALTVRNEAGVDGLFTIHEIKAVNNRKGTSLNLNAPFIAQPVPVKRAFQNPSVPGITHFPLTTGNSNIEQVIESLPDEFQYALDVDLNPNGNQLNFQDFAHYESGVSITLDMEVPLSLFASDLTLRDTFDFNLNGSAAKGNGEGEDIKEGLFTFYVENGFPLTADVQLYFLDAGGVLLDSLFLPKGTIEAAPLAGGTCTVVEAKSSQLQAKVPPEKVELLRQAKFAVMEAAFSTPTNSSCQPYLKLYSGYKFDFKLTGRIVYNVNL